MTPQEKHLTKIIADMTIQLKGLNSDLEDAYLEIKALRLWIVDRHVGLVDPQLGPYKTQILQTEKEEAFQEERNK